MKAILTTINPPTKAVEELAKRCEVLVIGDKKTPDNWSYEGVEYYDIESQKSLPFHINYYLEENHYSRKNLGYLIAMQQGVESMIDVDDDTYPNHNWLLREQETEANAGLGDGWFNVYNALSDEYIWPRGFSLNHLKKEAPVGEDVKKISSSIQQCLVDGDPDVDAIWRIVLKREHFFALKKSVYLKPFSWCPFNSQCTWWFPKAFALMYLPVYSPFRMTDIWRSFIAQRCIWEVDDVVTFHSPSEYFQERNAHDLIKDLDGEIKGYTLNDKIINILCSINLKHGDENVCENLIACYQAIIDEEIMPEAEMRSVYSWVKDYKSIYGK